MVYLCLDLFLRCSCFSGSRMIINTYFCSCRLFGSVLFFNALHGSRLFLFFFYKQKTAYEWRIGDWSSDVCSSDLIEIAREARMMPIMEIGARLGIPADKLSPYGHTKAKLDLGYIAGLADRPDGKLILVTGITPTAAGEGKTTTSVGLGDALNRIGKRAAICLREPSLGPCFGMKGGAAGGGYAQVVPMEDINLHFTGDFHAIAAANNLLAAMIDNHVYWGNTTGLDPRRITWKRAMDMNDRALRQIVNSLGGVANGYPREDGFDIVVASEVMAILCLSSSLADLKRRLGSIVVGYPRPRPPRTGERRGGKTGV